MKGSTYALAPDHRIGQTVLVVLWICRDRAARRHHDAAVQRQQDPPAARPPDQPVTAIGPSSVIRNGWRCHRCRPNCLDRFAEPALRRCHGRALRAPLAPARQPEPAGPSRFAADGHASTRSQASLPTRRRWQQR